MSENPAPCWSMLRPGFDVTGKIVTWPRHTQRDFAAHSNVCVTRGETKHSSRGASGNAHHGSSICLGRTIFRGAGAFAKKGDGADYRYSFDMLGEADSLLPMPNAISRPTKMQLMLLASRPVSKFFAAPSISIKLSALHPSRSRQRRTR